MERIGFNIAKLALDVVFTVSSVIMHYLVAMVSSEVNSEIYGIMFIDSTFFMLNCNDTINNFLNVSFLE